MRERVIECL
jgi:hypothetical protein